MRIQDFQYVRPRTLIEACVFLSEHSNDANLLAGGSDIVVALKQKRVQPEVVVDLRGLEELKHMNFNDKGLQIGSMVTLDRVALDSDIQKRYAVLSEAAFSVGAVQHQTMGTVGGNICLDTRCCYFNQSVAWRKARPVCTKLGGDICHVMNKGGGVCYAVFSADLATGLVAMDAEVSLISSQGERTLPLEEFYTGNGLTPNVLRSDEIVREVRIGASQLDVKSLYSKRRVRQAIDFGQAGIAIALWQEKQTAIIKKARIVLSSLGSGPTRVREAEGLLVERLVNRETLHEVEKLVTKAARPVSNVFGATVSYRREVAGALASEGIRNLLKLDESN